MRRAERHIKVQETCEYHTLGTISKSTRDKKYQATFLHSVVGIPMLLDSVYYVTRTGMRFVLEVKIHSGSLFNQTAAKHIPSIVDLMKITTEKKFGDLKALTTRTKKKSKYYAVLAPPLMESDQKINMTPAQLLVAIVAIVAYIRVMVVPLPSTPISTKAAASPTTFLAVSMLIV